MARFLCLSDLHVDVNGRDDTFKLTKKQRENIDAVLIAGDIAGGATVVMDFLTKNYPNTPVVFLGGNHLIYSSEGFLKPISSVNHKLNLLTKDTPYHFLENDVVIIGDTAVIGTNLYTDYKLGKPVYLRQLDEDGDPIAKDGRKLLKDPFLEWLKDPKNAYYSSLDCPNDEFVAARAKIICPLDRKFDDWAKEYPEAAVAVRAYEEDKKNQWEKKATVAQMQTWNMRFAQRYMNDFEYGWSDNFNSTLGMFERLSPVDYLKYHKKAVKFIRRAYATYTAAGYKVVIMTHHAPHPLCLVPKYRSADSAASYASDLTKLLRSVPQTSFWLFGHTHNSFDGTIEGVRLVNNAYGYKMYNEHKDWNPNLIIET